MSERLRAAGIHAAFFYLLFSLHLCAMLLALLLLYCRASRLWRSRDARPVVAFFHPYCGAGGGGERVLWTAVAALAVKYPQYQIAVFTGDSESDETLRETAARRFGITVPPEVRFVRLRLRWLVEAKWYPVCTMLGQSFGSLLLGLEAVCKLQPQVYIDSMGYAFTLPLFYCLAASAVGAYVHYPTISTDMLQAVESQSEAVVHNSSAIRRSAWLTALKLQYYRLFAAAYGLAGRLSCHVCMVNSSWTRSHISLLWDCEELHVVYPPCDVSRLLQLPRSPASPPLIISVAQFRPEKAHRLQLEAVARVSSPCRLLLVGGCRDEADRARVAELKGLAKKLDIEVEFRVNEEYPELLRLLSTATVGLHTMWNEHFGISVVEGQAAGLVMLAHRSGGPLLDIVVPEEEGQVTGFLASTAEEYAATLDQILSLPEEQLDAISRAARRSSTRFSEEAFCTGFLSCFEQLHQVAAMS